MNRQYLYTLGAILLASSALAGCASDQVVAVMTGLKDDKADACVSVTTSVAGYSGTATACRANSENGGQVAVDRAGVTTITRNGQPVAAAAPAKTP